MPIKYKLETLDGVDAAIAALYSEKDEAGKKLFVLDVEGAVDETRLNEFRSNNVTLKKQIAEVNHRFDGIDPDEHRKLKEAVGGLSADEIPEIVSKAKNLEKVIETRTAAMRAEHDKTVGKLTADRDRIQGQLSELSINQAVLAEATKLGLKPTAQVDITTRARQVFKLDSNGSPVAYEADGKTMKYGKDTNPLSIVEWCESMKVVAPHLFEESKGTGNAAGSGNGNDSGGEKGNPFKKGSSSYSVTKQMVMMKQDPAKARRLAAEAGVTLPK